MFDKPRQSDIGVNLGTFDKVAGVRPEHPDRKARMGFIGVGWWATTNHMPMLHVRRDVSMASACGLDKDVLRRVRKDFGFEHTTTDVRELLEQDLDGVIVATPHPLHAEHAIAAMDAGCHVMVEKPMTTTIEQAKGAACESKGNEAYRDAVVRLAPPAAVRQSQGDDRRWAAWRSGARGLPHGNAGQKPLRGRQLRLCR